MSVRKLIVATTEGGAITGEERLREHTDQLYGAILSYEGKPADYQVARIDSLRRELTDVIQDFEKLLTNELPKLNETLKAKGQPAIEPPPAKVAVNEPDYGTGGGVTSYGPAIPICPPALYHSRRTSSCCANTRLANTNVSSGRESGGPMPQHGTR